MCSFLTQGLHFRMCDMRDASTLNFKTPLPHHPLSIKRIEGYTIASNTSKCKAVDFKTALGAWSGNVSCTLKSCGVPLSLGNTLHTSVERHCLETVTYNCISGYSLNGLRYGKREFLLVCKSDDTYDDVPHLKCQPINCTLEMRPLRR